MVEGLTSDKDIGDSFPSHVRGGKADDNRAVVVEGEKTFLRFSLFFFFFSEISSEVTSWE